MGCKGVLACRAVKQLSPFFLALLALATVFTLPVGAQTTATVTPINYGAAAGILQAGDGNFYALSGYGSTCDTDSSQYCSYVYQLKSDGTVSTFHTFPPVPTSAGNTAVNTEGYLPVALFVGTDGNFYGACQAGGPGGFGTIFQITPAGVLKVLKSFGVTANNADPGSSPNSMIQGGDGNFYFTNPAGVYQLTPAGGFRTVFAFAGTSHGGNPTSIMQASDGNFYLTLGAAPVPAPITPNYGAIVQITPGGQWSLVHAFALDGSEGTSPGGSLVGGSLVEGSDGELYGVSQVVINTVKTGVAYKVSLGGAITLLHSFTGPIFNSWDSGLFVGSDGNIYGTTLQGGDTASANCTPRGCGSFYQLTPSGTFTDLHDFEGGKVDPSNPPIPPTIGGAGPSTLVQTAGGLFYGTQLGDPGATPVVYKTSLTPAIPAPIQLTFDPATDVKPGDTVTLIWSVLNAFSLTAQQCGASIVDNPISAGSWTGPQKGSLSGGIYGGSAKITPTANGVYTYALTCGGKESGFAKLVVNDAGPLQIVTQSLNPATVSQPYNALMTAIGGFPPYTWSVNDENLPPGLEFDTETGTLSGTPEQFGKYSLVFYVKDTSQPPPDPLPSQAITITVKSGLILVPNLLNPILGAAYSGSLAADTSGGLPPYTWQLTAGPLPPGLQLNSTTGLISGTPTALGQFSFTITVSDSENNPDKVPVTFNLKVAGPLQVITGSPLPAAAVGVPYSSTLVASGGTPPYSWSFGNNVAGNVPPGLSLTTDGTLVGMPTQFTPPSAQYNTFNVVVSDSSTPKQTAPAALSILVARTLKIETAALPAATVGVTTDVPLTASGGVPPYTWTATALPNPNIGVQIVNGNSLEYNPIAATNSIITLTVKDSENIADTNQVNLPLTIMPLQLATTTTLTSSNSTAGTSQRVVLTAKVTQPQGGVSPTGQVTFFNGNAILGTATLDANATATLQTSFANTGVYIITASYGGNSIYALSVSSPLTETIVTPSVNGSISPSSITIKSGQTGQLIITINPVGDYTGTINFSCGTLPLHVSCSFNPPSLTIPANSGPITDTLTVSTGATHVASAIEPSSSRGSKPAGIFSAATFWLPGSLGLLLTMVSRKRSAFVPQRRNRWLVATLLILCAMGLAGCGGTTANKAAPGTYKISVSLTVQGQAAQSIDATVIVQ
jgi:uncharacterized repeat protein (TIGR03803 family)